MFVDRVEVELIAGKGGNGCVSFRREKYVPRGGPDGGDGGRGGSIIVRAQRGVNSLAALGHQHFWRAGDGSHGSGANKSGRDGADLLIEVPAGTLIRDAEHGFVLRDLVAEGEEVVVARGGESGKGNLRFKSSTNRAPRESTPGGEGEHRRVIFELKVIADVGLIGKPNAGKSTLLSRLSRARPAIADYPFTTKFPNLGIVRSDEDHTFVLADIPGLIEGAHAGAGLGHEFLRHIERAGILVHLIEPLPADQTDPIDNYRTIRGELTQYDAELGQRPEITVVTKAELPGAAEVKQRLQEECGVAALLISAVTGEGLNQLIRVIASQLAARAAP